MISDTERREVARRLRERAGKRILNLGELLWCIGCDDGDDAAAWNRLADLIEPSGHECVPGECPINIRHDNDMIDRDALLEEVKELEKCAWYFGLDFDEDEPLRDRLEEASEDFAGIASRIRETLEVES